MDWEAPAIVLDARPYGEGDAVAGVMTEAHGLHRGLARGGAGRAGAATWQAGNLVQVRWVARLAEQLGSFSAELVHPAAALAMDDPLALAMLSAACAVAEGALPEREPHPRVFHGLLRLHRPAVAGVAYAGRAGAVGDAAAGRSRLRPRPDRLRRYRRDSRPCLRLAAHRPGGDRGGGRDWSGRLLRLPGFLVGANTSGPADWRDGLALTGHFLARDAFGHHHRPLPAARRMLYDRVVALAAESDAQATDTQAVATPATGSSESETKDAG